MTYWPAEVAHRAPVNDFPPAWASAWGDDRYGLWADLVVGGVTQRMRWIEPTMGDGFLMGSPIDEIENLENKDVRTWAKRVETSPIHNRIEKGFWIANTPCTQQLWQTVIGDNPSHFISNKNPNQYPVECVPMNGGSTGKGIFDFLEILNNSSSNYVISLPSELQWEYACRADTNTAYWWGDKFDKSKANSANPDNFKTEKNTTNPVNKFPPNPWGLFDMHGNVWEWCRDPWVQKLGSNHPTQGEATFCVRGGSCISHPESARSASRFRWHKADRVLNLGFRFILEKHCLQ